MTATLCLFSCLLVPAQSSDRTDWLLAPHLSRAQELVYRGTFTEEALGPRVQFNRACRMEARVFVLDTTAKGAEAAFYTAFKPQGGRPGPAGARPGDGEPASSVRLELARVEPRGRVAADAALAVPLDGPPSVECGAFVEAPTKRVGVGQVWEVSEDGRPPRTWKLVGGEMVNGTSCLKLVGVQQTDDWDRPRADRAAWQRQDTVWLSLRLGVAYRVERVIERREAARNEPTYRSALRYELETNLQYPGQLFEDRRREILQARSFADAAAPLLAAAARNPSQRDALLAKVTYHLDNHPPTPYREAVLQVKRRLEAARRGETVAVVAQEPAPAVQVAAVGQPAPDFVTSDLVTHESARLRRWLGRPVLLVFYNPSSTTTDGLLRFAQSLSDNYPKEVAVAALCLSEDTEAVLKQRRLTIPVLSGTGLRLSYAVDATPKLILVDAEGVVRGTYAGWGRETSVEVVAELKRWLARARQPK
jgi:peroxiredoxin